MNMPFPCLRNVFVILYSLPLVLGNLIARDNVQHGMDMDMDMGMQLAEGQMIPYLHFQGGDVLWFRGWVPQSKGAMVGTCIGLFLLAVFDRWLSAMRAVAENHWNKRAQTLKINQINAKLSFEQSSHTGENKALRLRTIPPAVPSYDIARGLLYAAQSLLTFAFMLAAMTFNAGILIAIVFGLGIGETLFGRYVTSTFSHGAQAVPDPDSGPNKKFFHSHAESHDFALNSRDTSSPLEAKISILQYHRTTELMSLDTGTPPEIPVEFRVYDSYAEAPAWQLRFSMIWVAAIGVAMVASLPRFWRAMRIRKLLTGFFGITENVEDYYQILTSERERSIAPMKEVAKHVPRQSFTQNIVYTASSVFLWTGPGLDLSIGQIIVIVGYLLSVILCMVLQAPLSENSNRAGFIALAQFPVVFLFATKNSILSFFLGPGNGYEKLNYVHRWAGRGMFLACLIHAAFWINNHLTWGFPILGQQKETSGVAALGLLCVIVITSIGPVRRAFYEIFFVIHVLAFVAFFITICYHTIFAPPWIFPPLAFFGLDMLLRFCRYRIKDAILIPIKEQMTLINIPYCTGGWTAGQHVRLRVFFGGRIFESHPLTILCAPPSTSCISNAYAPGMMLGARSIGNWSKALNEFARNAGAKNQTVLDAQVEKESMGNTQTPVQVMIDGPYGGCSLDLGQYETILLIAGGAGATFTIGLLDDIVGRCVRLSRSRGERTRRIEFAWCVKSFGSIEWFAPALMEISRTAAASCQSPMPLSLHMSIYVTCLCNPEAIPDILNCDVTVVRPDVRRVLLDLATPPDSLSLPISSRFTTTTTQSVSSDFSSPPLSIRDGQEITTISDQGHITTAPIHMASSSSADVESLKGLEVHASRRLPWVGDGGGMAVCASGPISLTREAANAVAGLRITTRGRAMGSIDIHTEIFAL